VDFSQIIGFIIVLLVLVLPILQKAIKSRHLKKHPELAPKEEEEEEEEFDPFLDSIESHEERGKRPMMTRSIRPPPPPEFEDAPPAQRYASEVPKVKHEVSKRSRRVLNDFRFKSDLDNYRQVSEVETRKLKEGRKPRIDPHIVSLDLEVKPAEIFNRPQVEPMTTHIQRLVRKRNITREMILMHEILSPPKSLR
jgi:hypothetical protein